MRFPTKVVVASKIFRALCAHLIYKLPPPPILKFLDPSLLGSVEMLATQVSYQVKLSRRDLTSFNFHINIVHALSKQLHIAKLLTVPILLVGFS